VYVAGAAFAYAPVRFFLDFLRMPETEAGADLRYASLTFAQYGCIALFLFGIGVVLYMRRTRGHDLAAPVLYRSQLQDAVPHRSAGTIASDVGEAWSRDEK
jgi:prolipoprotein diacylglyceryltransferase